MEGPKDVFGEVLRLTRVKLAKGKGGFSTFAKNKHAGPGLR